jgi:uncharacterized protein (DUF1501 family)
MAHTRRQFIRRGITFVGASLVAPRLLLGARSGVARAAAPSSGRILVVVELAGGNDGLNTVVPFTDSRYYSFRPRIAVRRDAVLEISDTLGLHPKLGALKTLFDQNRVAIVQGVGYPSPDLSHFRSTEIWQTAVPDTVSSTGWLGRYLDQTAVAGSLEIDAISLGYETPAALTTAVSSGVAAIDSFDSYVFSGDPARPDDDANKRAAFAGLYDDVRGSNATIDFIADTGLAALSSSDAVQRAAHGYVPAVAYPTDAFGQSLLKIAELVGANLGTDIYYTSLGSFDTHANQLQTQPALLGQLSDGLAAFYQDMAAHGRADDLLVMTFSEFGRRVNDNQSGGTDHGTAAPLFVLGNAVSGGIYGDDPSLSHLDDNDDLIFGIDFRSVYATVVRHWLQTDPEPILGGSFEDVGFLGS